MVVIVPSRLFPGNGIDLVEKVLLVHRSQFGFLALESHKQSIGWIVVLSIVSRHTLTLAMWCGMDLFPWTEYAKKDLGQSVCSLVSIYCFSTEGFQYTIGTSWAIWEIRVSTSLSA